MILSHQTRIYNLHRAKHATVGWSSQVPGCLVKWTETSLEQEIGSEGLSAGTYISDQWHWMWPLTPLDRRVDPLVHLLDISDIHEKRVYLGTGPLK